MVLLYNFFSNSAAPIPDCVESFMVNLLNYARNFIFDNANVVDDDDDFFSPIENAFYTYMNAYPITNDQITNFRAYYDYDSILQVSFDFDSNHYSFRYYRN